MKNNLLTILLIIFTFWHCKDVNIKKEKEPIRIAITEQDYSKVKINKFSVAIDLKALRNLTLPDASEFIKSSGIKYAKIYPEIVQKKSGSNQLFHQMNSQMVDSIGAQIREANLKITSYGIIKIKGDTTEIRRIFDFAKNLKLEFLIIEPLVQNLSVIEQFVQQYNIKVALCFPFDSLKVDSWKKFTENYSLLDDRIGFDLNISKFMNTDIDVLNVIKKNKERIFDVHLNVNLSENEKLIRNILAQLTLQNYHGYITIGSDKDEMINPSVVLEKNIKKLKDLTYYFDYEKLINWENGLSNKHGWNHYGPGHFVLDRPSGILTSTGGMGLLWYSRKKFKDFVLEFDFLCHEKNTNSGVFLRIPDFVVSNDYIYHSFEVQIDEKAPKDIHQTGAIYDAEPPRVKATKSAGKWNHYKITFIDDNIKVELNDILVNDWNLEPRGKIKDFAEAGFIGFQNHDFETSISFQNIYIKEIH